ncbi:hypothetical protein CAOG_07045 [Capsaspora owczarzaki ATCC 30864]|nr:hypothetical protein CAOG_07045 [Capsaspora owczarzaki ATCC 30864]|eukprot:XP_004343769.1 hypothetical protein CAOG_07045 [Capsaspora owczarzaki ATCC 30864]
MAAAQPQSVTITLRELGALNAPTDLQTQLLQHNVLHLFSRDVPYGFLGVQPLLTGRASAPPHYLTGPGGVGKSGILFMLVVEVLRHNNAVLNGRASPVPNAANEPVLIIYVPNADEIVSAAPQVAAELMLGHVHRANDNALQVEQWPSTISTRVRDWWTKLRQTLDRDAPALEIWEAVLALLRQQPLRALFAIDQWNALVTASNLPDNHPLRPMRSIAFATYLSQLITAVSSSFGAVVLQPGVFRDAERTTRQVDVRRLTPAEGEALRGIWNQRASPIVSPQDMRAVVERTGGIPRLCEFYYWSRRDTAMAFDRLCINYYLERFHGVARHLAGRLDDTDMTRRFQEDLVSLYLQRPSLQSSPSVTALWESTGMLIRDNNDLNKLIPLNAFVMSAATMFIDSTLAHRLSTIYHDPPIRWRALELFVAACLRSNRLTAIHSTNLRRDTRRKPFTIQCTAPHFLDASFCSDVTAYLAQHNGGQPFPLGTLLAPAFNLPVVDYVTFAPCGDPQGRRAVTHELVFIQVSAGSYADHHTKLPHLYQQPPSWGDTLLRSFERAFGIAPAAVPIDRTQLPPRVRYIYITVSSVRMQRNTLGSGSLVHLVSENDVEEMDRARWAAMAQ